VKEWPFYPEWAFRIVAHKFNRPVWELQGREPTEIDIYREAELIEVQDEISNRRAGIYVPGHFQRKNSLFDMPIGN